MQGVEWPRHFASFIFYYNILNHYLSSEEYIGCKAYSHQLLAEDYLAFVLLMDFKRREVFLYKELRILPR